METYRFKDSHGGEDGDCILYCDANFTYKLHGATTQGSRQLLLWKLFHDLHPEMSHLKHSSYTHVLKGKCMQFLLERELVILLVVGTPASYSDIKLQSQSWHWLLWDLLCVTASDPLWNQTSWEVFFKLYFEFSWLWRCHC